MIQAVQLPSFATLEDCVTAEHCMTAEHFHDCHSSGVMASLHAQCSSLLALVRSL